MIRLPGYQVSEVLYESMMSFVYRGYREQDGQPVILKMLRQDYPSPDAIARYKLEYEITRSLNLEGVVKAHALEKYRNSLVIILEDFGGQSLSLLMNSKKFTLEEVLSIVIQTADHLGQIHQHHIIHKDINPSNIVLNPATEQLKIIDFGISTILSRETPTIRNPKVLEGTLAYISPEQTGRMNRALDYRTDFYSLGVTFYELLAHQLPFTTTDALELVHFHIAKQPIPPHELNPDIPPSISKIVLKLLAKTAEERYQSASGIKADLEWCLTHLKRQGNIDHFLLGTQDIVDKFQIPQKLYGREREIETLLTAFERVSQGKKEIVLVSGYSGIGKSALVQEIHKAITRQQGYFIAGKFEQLKKNIPYSAVIQAFRELIRQILTESEAQITVWREKILRAVGTNSQILIEGIPELELLIGKQPNVLELAPTESQNRLRLVFQNFISVFANPEHPLIIFLDDLQWADAASLRLIQLLMTEFESQCLLLIGAYRDHEVSPTHPLILTLNEIKKKETIIHEIYLLPLELIQINQLVAETLNCEESTVKPLAKLVFHKTNGNPFFVNEFLKTIYTNGLLKFDYAQSAWQWNLEQIQAAPLADNVVELLANNLLKLQDATQQVLMLAACIGSQFDLLTLSIVYEKTPAATASELWEAVQSGFILPLGNDYKFLQINDDLQTVHQDYSNFNKISYKFLHDRVQQAAYSLIPEERKQWVHLQIGKQLLKNTSPNEQEEKIFDIANQLNLSKNLISNPEERNELAQLNLMAGQKAKASVAYEPASNYLNIGLALLDKNTWDQHYELTLNLHVEAAEAAYLSGDFDQMENLTKAALGQSRTLLDRVKMYEIEIQARTAQNQLLQAVKTALTVLSLLGLTFPKQPKKLNTLLSLLQTKLTLAGKKIENLTDLPEMTDPIALAAMRLMLKTGSAAYLAVPELMPLLVFKAVNLSIQYGNASESVSIYAGYGFILCGALGEIDAGYQFGKLALNLLDKLNAKELQAKTLLVVNDLIRHWKEHLRETIQPLLEAYKSGLETGDLEFAALSINAYSYHAYFMGQELSGLEQEMGHYRDAISKLKQQTTLHLLEIWRQVVLNLLGRSEHQYYLIGESYHEEKMLPIHLAANDKTALFVLFFNKLVLCYLFSQYSEAIENAAITEKYLPGGLGTITVALFYFYDSLARLAVFPMVSSSEKKNILARVNFNQKKLKIRAHHAPMNHLHKFYLVEAERRRILGLDAQAMEDYDRAIELAKANEYLQEEALACELAAKFYLARGKEKIAQVYMLDALYCYQNWGAVAKVKDLHERYPQLLFRNRELTMVRSGSITGTAPTKLSDRDPTTGSGSSEALDLATVMKASQALSREIVLDKLLAKLMTILIESAGAQKGYLILEKKGKLFIEAEGAVERDRVMVLQSISLESDSTPFLSKGIINYVVRTQETVVLNDATREGNFTKDPYIIENQPQSILCLPLLNQGQLISIVYLENNLIPGAFTPDRLEVLKLLSFQAAISIQNAKLYSELRESESRLAQFLDAMPVGVRVFDANGKIYYANRAAQRLLGRGVLTSVQLDQFSEVYQIYQAGTHQLYPNNQLPVARALKGESSTVDDAEIYKPDRIIPLEAWGTPILDENGNVAYAIVAFQDITERKRAEAERIKFTQELLQLNQAYERFVPKEFLQLLEKNSIVDVDLGDQVQKEMSVLFADIRSFTTLSESMTPEENFQFINAYLSRMEPAILENNGFIDKYIGDGIMALFSGGADDAIRAAIAMLQRLADYNLSRQRPGRTPIRIGIGINTGCLMLGTVGGKNRMESTVISDAVNLASRIEGLTKEYGVSLLISHKTFLQLEDASRYAIRIIDRTKVKGKSTAVTVYEVFDADPPEIRDVKLATKTIFEQGLMLYYLQKLGEAAQLFQDCLRQNPQDKVAQIYLERCQGELELLMGNG